MAHRVFIVEDEPKVAAIVAAHLARYGLDARRAARFDDLKAELVEVDPHPVLLDVNLPYFDGFYWCRQFRSVTTAPIIFVSARSSGMDQVLAMENGADDFVVKPFDLDVVTAKVRAALRRSVGEYSAAPPPEAGLEAGGLAFDPERLVATFGGGRVELTRKEGLLLAALIRAGGAVVERRALLAALWDDAEFVDDNTLTVNVNRLRRRLAELGLGDAVRTVRGEGYRLEVAA